MENKTVSSRKHEDNASRLTELRDSLHQCDEIIIDALLMRGKIIEDIMSFKEEHGMPVLQPEQEARQNSWLSERLSGKRFSEEIRDIFHCIRENSKRIQARRLFDYNIFLIGFMGAGKSTMTGYMQTLFAMKTIEMDEVIASREGMSISDIFEVHGEAYFRSLETALLSELKGESNVLVSCGGGAPMREENVAEMKKSGRIVLLTAAPETILGRVKDEHSRPILENNKSVGFISSLMEKRRPKYEAAADLTVATDGKTPLEICNDIIDGLLKLDRIQESSAR